jgi:hypothetical protein
MSCACRGRRGESHPNNPSAAPNFNGVAKMEAHYIDITADKPATAPAEEEHQPSCFALEEEKGECWRGSGSTKPAINDVRPSL